MLHAVIDCDGFTEAANYLHLSQSAISYTLAKLQEQLGVPLLKTEGRKAYITDEGRKLLERSRNLIREAIELEALAENLRMGWNSEICLMVDHNFPTNLLMLALRKFSQFAQDIKITLHEATMHQAEKALRERTADLVISPQVPSGFTGDALIEVEYVAVAHPAHPLFSLGRSITPADLKRQVQMIIFNSKDFMQNNGKHHSVGCLQPWNVNSFDTAIAALRECLGYAWLPKHRLQDWLARDELRILPLDVESTYKTNLYLVQGNSLGSNRGVKKLAEVLYSFAAHGASSSGMEPT